MKRFLVVSGVFLLCGLLVGCSSDTREGLVKETITMLDAAATDIGIINTKVKAAVEVSKTEGKKLDLTEAMGATKKLKETGDQAQLVKRRIEQVRAQITDEERKAYAKSLKNELNAAFAALLKNKEALRATLAEAEKLGTQAQGAVADLRAKIVEAESPFESLSR
jgi:hypothetical protein